MFCSLSSLKKREKDKKTGSVPVYLNVYDLTPFNGYGKWVGLGIYHSGVQVHGVEYGFGAHERPSTGIFEVEPRKFPGFTFRKSVLIGRTDSDAKEVRALMEKLAREYPGNSYHLITKNCNHFCNHVCVQLTGNTIPSWVNRLARLGLICKCVLPVELNETKISPVKAEDRMQDPEKKKLRSQSTREVSSLDPFSRLSMVNNSSSSDNRSRGQKGRPSLLHSASTSRSGLKL